MWACAVQRCMWSMMEPLREAALLTRSVCCSGGTLDVCPARWLRAAYVVLAMVARVLTPQQR